MRKSSILASFAPWGLCLLGVIFLLWRCRYSIDLTDEPAYLALGFKLMQQGDVPFIDEIFIGPKHSSILNWLLVSHFMPYSIYSMRLVAVIFYALCLFTLTLACGGRKLRWLGMVGFLIALLFDCFFMPTWSHNWWARNFLYLFFSCLLATGRIKNPKGKVALFLFAGLFLSVATIAYNTLIPVFLVTLFCMVLVQQEKHLGLTFAGGFTGAITSYCAFLVSKGWFWPWVESLSATHSLSIYQQNIGLLKPWIVLKFMVQSEAWLLAAIILITGYPHLDVVIPRIKGRIGTALLLFVAAYLGMKFFFIDHLETSFQSLVGLGVGAALLSLLRGIKEQRFIESTFGVVTLLSAFLFAVSSTNGHLALFWTLPAAILFFSISLDKQAEVPLSAEGSKTGLALVGSWLCFGALSALYAQATTTYFDLPPDDLTTEVSIPPFQHLFTTPRRAFLLQKLHEVTAGKAFVLSHHTVPAIFMFPGVRASTDSIFEDDGAQRSVRIRSLRKMQEKGRFPERLILVKTNPWSWGVTLRRIEYRTQDPIFLFAKCVKGKVVESLPEFEVYETVSSKTTACLEEAMGDGK